MTTVATVYVNVDNMGGDNDSENLAIATLYAGHLKYLLTQYGYVAGSVEVELVRTEGAPQCPDLYLDGAEEEADFTCALEACAQEAFVHASNLVKD